MHHEEFEIHRAVLADPGDAPGRTLRPRPVRHAAGARIIGEDLVTVAQGDSTALPGAQDVEVVPIILGNASRGALKCAYAGRCS
jgi:hypothetical protein